MSDEIEIGPLLAARLAWEAENPRPESLRKIERMIVRGLVADGFGRQYQVTREDGFEIAVGDLLIRVEIDKSLSASSGVGEAVATQPEEK